MAARAAPKDGPSVVKPGRVMYQISRRHRRMIAREAFRLGDVTELPVFNAHAHSRNASKKMKARRPVV